MWVPGSVAFGSELDVLSSIRVIETISAGDEGLAFVAGRLRTALHSSR